MKVKKNVLKLFKRILIDKAALCSRQSDNRYDTFVSIQSTSSQTYYPRALVCEEGGGKEGWVATSWKLISHILGEGSSSTTALFKICQRKLTSDLFAVNNFTNRSYFNLNLSQSAFKYNICQN